MLPVRVNVVDGRRAGMREGQVAVDDASAEPATPAVTFEDRQPCTTADPREAAPGLTLVSSALPRDVPAERRAVDLTAIALGELGPADGALTGLLCDPQVDAPTGRRTEDAALRRKDVATGPTSARVDRKDPAAARTPERGAPDSADAQNRRTSHTAMDGRRWDHSGAVRWPGAGAPTARVAIDTTMTDSAYRAAKQWSRTGSADRWGVLGLNSRIASLCEGCGPGRLEAEIVDPPLPLHAAPPTAASASSSALAAMGWGRRIMPPSPSATRGSRDRRGT